MDLRAKTLVFVLSAMAAGAGTGAALGWFGRQLPEGARFGAVSSAALVAVVLALFEGTGRRVPLLQLDRETPQSWLNLGPFPWGILNGGALGVGFLTRVGFPLWYGIPVAAIAFAHPVLGALIFGSYATVRTVLAWPSFCLSRAVGDRHDLLLLLVRLEPSAHAVSSYGLILLASFVIVSVGY